MYNSMSSANRVLLLFFPIWIPFVYFSSLITVAKTSKTILGNNGKSEHPSLVPNYRGNALFFNIDNVFCQFVIYGLYYVEVCSSYAYFLESFYHKWVLNFVKSFLCIYWDDHIIFIFQFLNIKLIDLYMLKNISQAFSPGMKPTWSWCMILLMCYWLLFARILLRIFASMFSSDIGL